MEAHSFRRASGIAVETMTSKKIRSTLQKVLSGRSDANIRFNDLLALLAELGFDQRIRGDHHILWRDGVEEIINLQPKANKAKPYQVKQVRRILTDYKLGFDDE